MAGRNGAKRVRSHVPNPDPLSSGSLNPRLRILNTVHKKRGDLYLRKGRMAGRNGAKRVRSHVPNPDPLSSGSLNPRLRILNTVHKKRGDLYLRKVAEVAVTRNQTPPSGRVTLSSDSALFSTSWETVVGDSYPGFAFAALVSYKDLNSSSDLLHKMRNKKSDDKERSVTYQLNS
ncbi:hypothetical protein G5714_000093 [Onychostoma macrolepis]|uniref:Uncharacterized protein n=1 Tax=Onychostoma macrolepis TaxID=369639 RepID=A0A7J6DFG1_9TELE|nr:hypothetical protein G5714_000093 [Onychostoma macrolepis]